MPTSLMNDSMSPKKATNLQQPQATNAPQGQQVCWCHGCFFFCWHSNWHDGNSFLLYCSQSMIMISSVILARLPYFPMMRLAMIVPAALLLSKACLEVRVIWSPAPLLTVVVHPLLALKDPLLMILVKLGNCGRMQVPTMVCNIELHQLPQKKNKNKKKGC